ncbi:MAG: hypothetical protein IJ991_15065 [Thermoguttaceae bacterium]|nr:hypothetical protein [Thermoguttaceae bacterium]
MEPATRALIAFLWAKAQEKQRREREEREKQERAEREKRLQEGRKLGIPNRPVCHEKCPRGKDLVFVGGKPVCYYDGAPCPPTAIRERILIERPTLIRR